MKVWLPATTIAKLVRQMADAGAQEEVLFRCCVIWENDGTLSQSPFPQQDQDKASVQSSCSNVKYSCLEPAGSC